MLRIARNILLVLLPLLAAVAWAQGDGQIYKTIDANGRIVYTDTPPKDRPVEMVRVQPTNTTPAPRMDPEAAPDDTAGSDNKPAKVLPYTRFEMSSPEDDEVMEYDVRSARLAVRIAPALQDGHTIQFYLDGQPVSAPGMALYVEVGGLDRGTHRAEARLRDERGRILKAAPVVQFEIRQHSDNIIDGSYIDGGYSPGARQPRGAQGAGGAGQPGGAQSIDGAESIEGVPSPGAPVPRPIRRRR